MKKITIYISIIFTVSSIAVVGLYYKTKDSEILSGDFTRSIYKGVLPIIHALNIDINKAYISGMSNDSIYLCSSSNPSVIEAINFRTGKSKKRSIKSTGAIWGRSFVDYPWIFQNRRNSEMLRVNLMDSKDTIRYQLPYFVDAIPLSKGVFALRAFNDHKTEFILAKSSLSGTIEYPKYLQKQIDGIFCTDGMIVYNSTNKKLFYVYYYRNQFLSMDSALRLVYRGKTIDSISHAKIKVAGGSSKTRSIASPARVVNQLIHSSGLILYINSKVMGLHESWEFHRQGSVLDCYQIDNGAYLASFYVPNYNHQQMVQFYTNETSFIALYKRNLVIYQIPEQAIIHL